MAIVFRDEDERRAWDRYAAGRAAARWQDGSAWSTSECAAFADEMIEQRRARYPQPEPQPEAEPDAVPVGWIRGKTVGLPTFTRADGAQVIALEPGEWEIEYEGPFEHVRDDIMDRAWPTAREAIAAAEAWIAAHPEVKS